MLGFDFQPRPKLKAPLLCSAAFQCTHDSILFIPPSCLIDGKVQWGAYHVLAIVAIPAGKGKHCETNSATSPDPFSS